ncbi:MAG: hypothetical protein WEB58_21925 [Planctomycetaceae bacterium]
MTFLVEPQTTDAQNPELLALWSRNLPDLGTIRQQWLYQSGAARNWFLQNADGSRIGSAGLMQRRMNCGDAEFIVGQTIDFNVDASFRSVGPAIALQRHLAAQLGSYAQGLLYGVPSPQAEGVLKRVGYKAVGTFERWVKPIRSFAKLHEYTQSKALACASTLFVDCMLKLRSRDTWLRVPSRYAVERLDRFDGRFDRLWDAAHRQFPIVGERNAQYLQWRFGDHPEREFDIFALASAGPREILGYVVSHVIGRGLTISDLFFRDAASLDWLLTAFLKQVRTEPVDTVTMVYLGSPLLADRLHAFGFYRRPFQRQLLVMPEKIQLPVNVFDSSHWYFTKADSDIDV